MPASTHSSDAGVPPLEFETFYNTIDGQKSKTKQTRHGINPANREANPEVPVVSMTEVDATVAASRNAFKSWAKTPMDERRAKVQDFAKALGSYKEEFAQLLTKEQGKPISTARTEIDLAGMWLNALSNIPMPEEVTDEGDARQIITRYTPLGVVVAIVPWNFPILLACGKIAPALITGNTLIIKPSPFTPYCDLKLGELAQSYFPPGVFQVISGDDRLGPWLTEHPGVDKISFTGSSATGKLVMASAAKTLKRVTLELGGNDPAIVCGDVNVDAVAPHIATLAFLNSGQICITIKRIYVHASIYDKFRDAVVGYVKTLKLGDGAQEDVTLGPIQNEMQFNKLKAMFSEIGSDNWQVAAGGKIDDTKGYFVNPTVIDNPKETSKIVTEEPFGPIIPLLKWDNEDDVISKANNTKMGLGASVWSADPATARRIADQLEAGNVWINDHFMLSPIVPFGGHKESGIGSEWGSSGLKAYCNAQTLFVKKT